MTSGSSGLSEARWLRFWLVALDVGVLLVGLGIGAWIDRRGYFLAALVPIALAPFTYARWRLHLAVSRALAGRRRGLAWLVSGAGVILDVILVAQLLTGRASDALPLLRAPGIEWAGPVWFSAHALLFLGYTAVAAVGRLRRAFRAVERTLLAPSAMRGAGPASPERRVFLERAGLVGAGLPFFVSLSGVSLSYDFRVEKREIEVPGWPRELDGLRVVHLSDIHVGGGMTRERLLRIADLVNACRPELIAHTGDFLTHRAGDFDAPLYEALARLRAPYGQWACLGNHDFDDAARLVGRLASAGAVVLRDRMARIDVAGEPLAGADFVFARSTHQASYARLARSWGVRGAASRILLNHDPSAFATLPAGAADLVLSGHTHGGHIGIQLGRDRALTVVGLVGLPDQGLFERGNMRLFVTRCVGFYGYPMRLGIPPEIAVLELRTPRAAAAV